MIRALRRFPVQFLLTLDQFANVLLLGYADETISARLYRAHRDGRVLGRIFMPVVDALFFWQDQHCKRAYDREKDNRYLPPEYRE